MKIPFFVFAPMDDVTDSVFRQIVASCAKPDLFITEFVNVDGLQSPGREKLLSKLRFTDKEKPIIAQLWGLKPENYYKTVREIVDGSLAKEANELRVKGGDAVHGSGEEQSEVYSEVRRMSTGDGDVVIHSKRSGVPSLAGQQAKASLNYAGVDINMGCPVRTVIKNGACATLINNRELAGQIIDAVKDAAGKNFPVSVKTRVGFTTTDMSWLEFLLNKKLNMLSIHGRTAKELSSVPANWDAISEVVKMRDILCPSTLVVGNGDVLAKSHGLELAKKYRLDGIMIGREIFHDPFIFADKSPWAEWTKEQKVDLFKKHIELYQTTYKDGERKFEALRKFCKVYINGFDGASELRAKFMQTSSPEEALELLTIQ